jgi:hypothetical protein
LSEEEFERKKVAKAKKSRIRLGEKAAGWGGGGGTADTRETLERAPFHITKDIIVLQALVLSSSLPGKIFFY